MWDENKSLVLSKICVILFMILLPMGAILAPWILNSLFGYSVLAHSMGRILFLTTIYVGCVPAAALLVFLYTLLRRISAGSVFVKENTACLRYISWCCFAGAVICLVSTLYYFLWFAIGVVAAFMGLIVRVIKNVVAKAISLQDDVDLTI